MTKEKDEILAALVSTAVTTGLAPTFGPGAGKLAGFVAGQGLKRLFGLARTALAKRDLRRFENWLHEVAANSEHGSPAATIRHIEDNIDQPWAHGPLEDAVRAIRDGIDEAALVYLAKLAAWQIRDKVPPDRWSRRAVGLLLDCDSRMVEALGHLTEHLPSRWPKSYGDVARIALGGPGPEFVGKANILPVVGRLAPLSPDQLWDPHPLYRELFALLRSHQFATEEGGPHAYEGKMLMTKVEAQYLVRLFHGSVATASFLT
jgi:hypothetical protein